MAIKHLKNKSASFKPNSSMQVKIYLILFFALFSSFALAQNERKWHQKPMFNISGFLDVFYVYDFNQPQVKKRQPFLYNHNRHKEFNLNLVFVKLGLEHSKYRANLALQKGTYVVDNYSAEPGLLKNIFEANIGLSLGKKNNLWLDAGVFASHIGFESAVSIDNWTITRSILAENSPYFFSGVKLNYNPNEKWNITGLLLNGWQRIQKRKGNSFPSLGTQINYRPTELATLNWSTFIGTDDPDTTRRMRLFNNFYGQYQLTDLFSFIAGIDIGIQQRFKNSSAYDLWYSPVIIGQFKLSKAWKTSIRAEYYQDEKGVIIPTSSAKGFRTTGFSLNFDYSPKENIICRLEGRCLNSRDNIFETKSNLTNNNFIIAASIAMKFSESIKRND